MRQHTPHKLIFGLATLLALTACGGDSQSTPETGLDTEEIAQDGTQPSAPIVQSIWSVGIPADPDSTIEVEVAASAASDVTLAYTWTGYDGWSLTGGQGTVTGTFQAPEDYGVSGTVVVQVDDGARSARAVLPVATVGNTAPGIQSVSVWPQPILETGFLNANASDDHDSNLEYTWSVAGLTVATGAATTWTHPGIPGEGLATLTVSDAEGLTTSAQQHVRLDSPAPWPRFGRDGQATRRSSVDTEHINGSTKWSYDTGSFVYSSPAVGPDGTIYVGSGDDHLYALHPDGSFKWSYITGDVVFSSPTIGADGTIYFGSEDENIYALKSDGSFKWSYDAGGDVSSSPAIGADGTIYVGATNSKLIALNPDGSLKWTYNTGSSVYSSPAIGRDGTIYVGAHDDKLHAVSPDGSLKWTYTTGSYVYSSPAIGRDGTIYVGSNDNNLYAISPGGNLEWTYTTGNVVSSSPAIGADGTIYVGSDDNNLYALSPDGSLKWTYSTGDSVASSPAIGADGTVFVGSHDNDLYALSPDGSLKWRYSASDEIDSSPAIGTDGTIYVGSDDDYLYAIE